MANPARLSAPRRPTIAMSVPRLYEKMYARVLENALSGSGTKKRIFFWARGVADHAPLRRVAGQAFALLVFAVRRGSKLATAMEARGFGAHRTRSWARPSPFSGREFALIAAGFAIAATATTVAVTTGNWNFIGHR